MRKDFYIKPCIQFVFDKELYMLLPTIMYQPSRYRYPGTFVITIQWLCFAVGISGWCVKGR